LPPFSPEVARRFLVTADFADFWADPAAAEHTRLQPFAGRTTPFERRFRARRLAIYYIELTPRPVAEAPTAWQAGTSGLGSPSASSPAIWQGIR
jgi:hypothetical protein